MQRPTTPAPEPGRSDDPTGARFFLDRPRLDGPGPIAVDPVASVAGWLLPAPGAPGPRAIELRVDGRKVAEASTGRERPDVMAAFPGRPDALRCGFEARLPLLDRAGQAVELAVVARWDDGEQILARSAVAVRAEAEAEGNSRVSEHWAEQFEAMRADASYWLNHPFLVDRTYRLISGTPRHWIPWLMGDYFRDVERFDRVLSVCCGDGAHELALYQTGKVGFIQGVDVSEGALARAAERFREAEVPEARFRFDVADANDLDVAGPFDLVVSSGAIHHVANLEGILDRVAALLGEGGRFVLQEFVGPDRFQWTDLQIELVNRLLGALDVEYLKDRRRIALERPPIEAMMAIDPSEAIRSSDILTLLRERFDVEYSRDFHGTLLHQLYPLLNPELTHQGRRDFDSIVRLIAEVEDVLIGSGVIPADFVFMVCRPRAAASRSAA